MGPLLFLLQKVSLGMDWTRIAISYNNHASDSYSVHLSIYNELNTKPLVVPFIHSPVDDDDVLEMTTTSHQRFPDSVLDRVEFEMLVARRQLFGLPADLCGDSQKKLYVILTRLDRFSFRSVSLKHGIPWKS